MTALSERLPLSFHETFVPERQYLRDLMRYAAQDGASADKEHIHEATDIPTGKHSGKVTSTMRYADGMGLLKKTGSTLSLTPFGRVVSNEDGKLDESLTQWLAHFHLARTHGGAELWYRVFAESGETLGSTFEEAELLTWLQHSGLKLEKLHPLPSMYSEPASFAKASILTVENGRLRRQSAPTAAYFGNGYAFLMLSLFEQHFPSAAQVTAKQFDEATRFFTIANWGERARQEVFDELSSIGAFRIERQLEDAVLTPIGSAETYLSSIYDELP